MLVLDGRGFESEVQRKERGFIGEVGNVEEHGDGDGAPSKGGGSK
jgi:hypothetical protein